MNYINDDVKTITDILVKYLPEFNKQGKGHVVRSFALSLTNLFPQDSNNVHNAINKWREDFQAETNRPKGEPAKEFKPLGVQGTKLPYSEPCDGCTGEQKRKVNNGAYKGLKPLQMLQNESQEVETEEKTANPNTPPAITELKDIEQIKKIAHGQPDPKLYLQTILKQVSSILPEDEQQIDNRWGINKLAERIAEVNNMEREKTGVKAWT